MTFLVANAISQRARASDWSWHFDAAIRALFDPWPGPHANGGGGPATRALALACDGNTATLLLPPKRPFGVAATEVAVL